MWRGVIRRKGTAGCGYMWNVHHIEGLFQSVISNVWVMSAVVFVLDKGRACFKGSAAAYT